MPCLMGLERRLILSAWSHELLNSSANRSKAEIQALFIGGAVCYIRVPSGLSAILIDVKVEGIRVFHFKNVVCIAGWVNSVVILPGTTFHITPFAFTRLRTLGIDGICSDKQSDDSNSRKNYHQ